MGRLKPFMILRALPFAAPILALSAALATADTGGDRFTSGMWQGEANYDAEGYFSDCTMSAEASINGQLGFIVRENLDWGLMISDSRNVFQPGGRLAAWLLIDAQEPVATVAKVAGAHGLLIPLEKSEAMLKRLRGAKELRVSTGVAEYRFEMTGAHEALGALTQCVTDHEGTTRVEL